MISLRTNATDHATPAIEAKIAKCSPQRLRAIVGPALNSHVKRHLIRNGTNKKGYPSTNFWADSARGTSWFTNAANGVIIIAINKIGVRQRFHGGTIKPVKASALAIPISPVSYGHVPRDFAGLFLLKTKKGAYLVQRDALPAGKESKTAAKKRRSALGGNAKRRLSGELNFLFKLMGSVTQRPNPDCIPSSDALMEIAMQRIEEAVK